MSYGNSEFTSKLSTIHSKCYGYKDIHDFSGYRGQEILDKNVGDLLGYYVMHWATYLEKFACFVQLSMWACNKAIRLAQTPYQTNKQAQNHKICTLYSTSTNSTWLGNIA